MEAAADRRPRRSRKSASGRRLSIEQSKLAADYIQLARRVAWHYWRRSMHLRDVDECLSVAMQGLVHAASLFDEKKGKRFGAYAAVVIWRRLMRADTQQQKHINTVHFGDSLPVDGVVCDGDSIPSAGELRCGDTSVISATYLREVVQIIQKLLPPRWFDALHMRYLLGMTRVEVAVRLGVGRARIWEMERQAITCVLKSLCVDSDGLVVPTARSSVHRAA